MLTYSVRPRGGVVHAVEVSEALVRRGHHVEIVALGRPGDRLFRETDVPVRIIRHTPVEDDFDDRIHGMIAAYRDGLAGIAAGLAPDVVHAQDCLSCNAALPLRDEGLLPHVLRTVHHVDEFRSPSLIACQDRSITGPDRVVCVSEPWVRRLADEYGVDAGRVANGVDRGRHRPPSPAGRAAARRRLGLDGRLTVLTIGGIEPRKGSLTLLRGFARLRERVPGARPLLVVAGGATLFDYRDEVDRFHRLRRELGLGDDEVRVTGPLGDDDVAAYLGASDVFAFPSVREGFGLVALEALASGLPVVASDLDVFAGFLVPERSALLHAVGDDRGLGDALVRVATEPGLAARLVAGGLAAADGLTWDAAAALHEDVYEGLVAAPRLPAPNAA